MTDVVKGDRMGLGTGMGKPGVAGWQTGPELAGQEWPGAGSWRECECACVNIRVTWVCVCV